MGRVLFIIKYYYNSGKYVTLTFDLWHMTLTFFLDLDPYAWPWGWSIATLFFEDNKINVWRHVTQKRYFVRYIGDNNPDRYFLKEHDAPN